MANLFELPNPKRSQDGSRGLQAAQPVAKLRISSYALVSMTLMYPHIQSDAGIPPFVAGTSTKVIEIVFDTLAHHWDAEEIQRQHSHLSLAQIHSALAYYYDHQTEMDADIERWIASENALRGRLENGPLLRKLRAVKYGGQ